MKKVLFFALMILGVFSCSAQDKKDSEKSDKEVVAPEVVGKAFAIKFPKATKTEWSMEKEGEYEVEFKLDNAEKSALYKEDGTLIEVETEIKEADLPQAIKTTLETDFKGYKTDDIEMTETNGTVNYELNAEKGEEEFTLVFDANGKLLKKEKAEED